MQICFLFCFGFLKLCKLQKRKTEKAETGNVVNGEGTKEGCDGKGKVIFAGRNGQRLGKALVRRNY